MVKENFDEHAGALERLFDLRKLRRLYATVGDPECIAQRHGDGCGSGLRQSGHQVALWGHRFVQSASPPAVGRTAELANPNLQYHIYKCRRSAITGRG